MMEHPLDVTYAGIKGYYLLLVLGGISIAFFAYQVQKRRVLFSLALLTTIRLLGEAAERDAYCLAWSTKSSGRQSSGNDARSHVLGIPYALLRYVGLGYSQSIQ